MAGPEAPAHVPTLLWGYSSREQRRGKGMHAAKATGRKYMAAVQSRQQPLQADQ